LIVQHKPRKQRENTRKGSSTGELARSNASEFSYILKDSIKVVKCVVEDVRMVDRVAQLKA